MSKASDAEPTTRYQYLYRIFQYPQTFDDAEEFNQHICPAEHHPLTHVASGVSWCKGTSNYVWHVSHRGDGTFYWKAIGVCEGDEAAIAEMVDAWRWGLARNYYSES